jgi:folate-dependent tRNA-U54 methylase TrmFO/GidA
MLGALQFYALHKELVDSGKMTNRAFHDALYREGNMPVEMVRLAVSGQKVTRDYKTSWKFYAFVG